VTATRSWRRYRLQRPRVGAPTERALRAGLIGVAGTGTLLQSGDKTRALTAADRNPGTRVMMAGARIGGYGGGAAARHIPVPALVIMACASRC